MAICLGYYQLSLLLVLVFQFLQGTPKKHRSLFSYNLSLPFVVFTLFRLKNARSIQYFILDPKTLRFPFCRSFFGQRIG